MIYGHAVNRPGVSVKPQVKVLRLSKSSLSNGSYLLFSNAIVNSWDVFSKEPLAYLTMWHGPVSWQLCCQFDLLH
jgi:hypothetical protein